MKDELIKRLKVALESSGLAKSRVGLDAGLSQTAVTDIISGKSKSPTLDTIVRIADALSVSPQYLMGFTDSSDGELSLSINNIPVIGIAGYASNDHPESISAPVSSRHTRHDLGAFKVCGDSCGCIYAICRRWAIDETPDVGKIAIVRNLSDANHVYKINHAGGFNWTLDPTLFSCNESPIHVGAGGDIDFLATVVMFYGNVEIS